MKKWFKKAVIGIVSLAVLLGAAYFWLSQEAAKQLAAVTYEEVVMERVADGVYIGETKAFMVEAKVQVTVRAGRIVGIEILEHKNGLGGKAEVITEAMIDANSYQVDTISGATLSSATIKSAVNKALKSGQK